jgi:hypothetical protein
MSGVGFDVVVREVYKQMHWATYRDGDDRTVVVDNSIWETIPELTRAQIRRHAHRINVRLELSLRD